MTIEQFSELCQDEVIRGYTLKPGQSAPENYQELVDFMANRLGLHFFEDLAFEALSYWLMSNKKHPESCNPEQDNEHVTAVILIGELVSRDAFVASLPVDDNALALPPPEIVRKLIQTQA